MAAPAFGLARQPDSRHTRGRIGVPPQACSAGVPPVIVLRSPVGYRRDAGATTGARDARCRIPAAALGPAAAHVLEAGDPNPKPGAWRETALNPLDGAVEELYKY